MTTVSSATAKAVTNVTMERFGRFWLPAWDEQAERHFVRTPRGCQLDHLDAAMAHVREWRCAVDGGAHVGSWTMALCKMFDRVLAFEPHPHTYACLVKNFSEARDAAEFRMSAELNCAALGNISGRAALVEERHASLSTKLDLRGPGPVQVVALDDVIRDEPPVDFLKLDVEGCEVLALLGARQTIARCKPVMLIECKDANLRAYRSSEEQLRETIAALGYDVVAEIEQDLIAVPRA